MNKEHFVKTSKQIDLWSILLICERLFHIYCTYSGREKDELRELLDELWTIDLENETYTEDQVSGIQNFIKSLYPKSGSGSEHIGSGFIVSLVDTYDYLVEEKSIYIESIKEQAIDTIKHHLESEFYDIDESPREMTAAEREKINTAHQVSREIKDQSDFEKEIKTKKLEDIKNKYIYNPIT